ncbi:hypothetical protein IC229_09170 [Spirosoma sp. BT702]|uniref:Uncharacterized protein n=1 Tax=Spirosoma profusum TaxID=2771354 RepID=A0A926XUZ4_9BACT|nr:hypothetical protein [Spirosoma profusum]MBD2700807.1 hypothetical protein [Spirosoma profusum]
MASRSNKLVLFTLFLILLNLTGWAQTFPLQIQVNVMPPYSAYLQDYPGTGQQVRVFIINTSRTTYQIRLSGQLTGDNGIEIKTSPNYRPPRPVTVPPGQTLLTRNDLEGLFDLNQIDVTGIDKNLLARGLPLPDGTYQLCVRAFNETATNTATVAFGQPLSAEFPIGCSAPIVVRSVEPPILIAPLCDADVMATTPQSLVFTWTPPAGVSPASVEYTLRVVELPQVDVDPNVFIDAVALPKSGVEVRNLRTSTLLYGPTQPPLQMGKRYAWRVQAIDRSRKLVFQNDGKSPVCAFTYGIVPKEQMKPGVELTQTPIKMAPIALDSSITSAPAQKTAIASVIEPPKQLNVNVPPAGLGQLVFAGQTIIVQKVTNPDQDHFSGRGTLTITSPVSLSTDVDFANLVIRPTSSDQSAKKGKNGFTSYVVVKGKLETSLKGVKQGRGAKFKTDRHTGGTASATYESIRLIADHTATLDQTLNTYSLNKGGNEEASIKTGFVWNSPITLTTIGAVNSGSGNKLSVGSVKTYDGNMTVEVPGEWHPLASAGQAASSETLKIPFGQSYSGQMTDLKGFRLEVKEDSYFEIQNNVLKAHLNGSLLVNGGKKGVPDLTIPFQNSDGITFTQQIDDPQIVLGTVDDQARLFLSFQAVNVQLGDLFEADDLPYPQWVKGISCPTVDLWAGKMVYMQDQDHPTSQDHLDWMTIPLNPIVNRGKGYESSYGGRDDLNIQSPYLGYKGKITHAVAFIKNTELTMGFVAGEVYIPFVGAVGDLQISIEKYGLGDADVFFTKPSERTLLQTPEGDQVTLKVTGGHFEDSYFHPDMWISAYNPTNSTRGIDARNIHMDGVDIAITPKGELVSNYVGKDAEAYFGGSNQKTAYLNGIDYQLARVVLADEPGGKNSRLSFVGKLVLGDKIVTKPQDEYDIVFAKPDKDAFEFDGTIKYQPINNGPKLPAGSGFGGGKKGSGPYNDPNDERYAAEFAPASLGYFLERSAPASAIVPTATKTYGGSYSTSTGAFSAQFTIFNDDATYGNGFMATHSMLLYNPSYMKVEAAIRAGKMQGVKYWFAGFKYENPSSPGIPLFLNLEGYGFEGRLYSHMKHVGAASAIFDDNYVPDANTSFGLYAAMPIQSTVDKGRFLWGKTGMEMAFQGFVPSTITIRGDVNMEQIGGTGDATTSRIQGNAVLTMTPKEKTLMGVVNMTKGDFGVACMTGSAYLYVGPSGFAASVGSPAGPVEVKAMCGLMGDFTPSANGYLSIYATNGSIGGMDWVPSSGIGVFAHLGVTLLNINTKDHFDTNPWASVYAGANADLGVTIRPSLDLKARVGTQISLNVGYSNYSFNLANVTETVQLTLPNFCLAYNKRICFPVLGGCNLIVGLSPGPYIRTNGEVSDMCYDDGSVQGPCEGLLGWLMDGVQVIINVAGEVLDAAGNLIRDAAGAVVDLAEDTWEALTGWW